MLVFLKAGLKLLNILGLLEEKKVQMGLRFLRFVGMESPGIRLEIYRVPTFWKVFLECPGNEKNVLECPGIVQNVKENPGN